MLIHSEGMRTANWNWEMCGNTTRRKYPGHAACHWDTRIDREY